MKKVFNKVVVAGLLSATIGISIATTVSCSQKKYNTGISTKHYIY